MSSFWQSNRRVIVFLAKALAVYGLWYVVYDLWLLPDGRLDRWLSLSAAEHTGQLVGLFGFDTAVQWRTVTLPGVPGIKIINGCNGLSTIGLFVGFVVAYPGDWRRRLAFIPLGVGAIYATNVLRTSVMLWVQKYWPAAFDPLHGFGLTTIFYVVVFLLWVVWMNYGDVESTEATGSAAEGVVSTGAA